MSFYLTGMGYLTSPYFILDQAFMKVFLLTFRFFSTPEKVFQLLANRFDLSVPANLSSDEDREWRDQKQRPVRYSVYVILKKWLEQYWFSEQDDPLLGAIKLFVESRVASVMAKEATYLKDLCGRRKQAQFTPQRSSVQSNSDAKSALEPAPAPMLPRNLRFFRLLDLDPLEVARQLTILEGSYFSAINPLQCLLYKPDHRAAKNSQSPDQIRALIQQSNQVTGWVAETILLEKEVRNRALTMKFFIRVAEKCHSLKNYATREAVLAALNSTPVFRLKKTWDILSTKSRSTFETLMKFMDRDNNFVTYRQTIRSSNPPCIPFLGKENIFRPYATTPITLTNFSIIDFLG
jgi:son of sevenless-like protein